MCQQWLGKSNDSRLKRFHIIWLSWIVFCLAVPDAWAANWLLISESADPVNSQDEPIVEWLEAAGHTVTVIDDDDVTEGIDDAIVDIDVVFASESGSSHKVGLIPADLPRPLIISEMYAWDEFQMSSVTGEGIGVTSTNIDIVNPNHYLAAGLSGSVQVLNSVSGRVGNGVVGPEATVIAQATISNETYDVIFVYEPGAALVDGSIAPEVRIGFGFAAETTEDWTDNTFKLLEAAVKKALSSTGPTASPAPFNQEEDVELDVVLSWSPVEQDLTYELYFGTDFNEVNDATTGISMDVNTYDPGLLDYAQTYYWRVDGVTDSETLKGIVWSFTAEPYSVVISEEDLNVTASSYDEDHTPTFLIDGSGLTDMAHSIDVDDMWISGESDEEIWLLFEFDAIQKMDKMLIWNSNYSLESFLGLGVKDVNILYSLDGDNWTVLAENARIPQAPGQDNYDTPKELEFGLVPVKYVKIDALESWSTSRSQCSLSEVQFLSLPLQARYPTPADGAVDVGAETELQWRPGREAAGHCLYLSADQNDVANGIAPSTTLTTNRSPLSDYDVTLGETYYWRVDEVNQAEVPAVCEGPVWSFTTPEVILVGGFESYPSEEAQIWHSWSDGYGYTYPDPGSHGNGTGALVDWNVDSARTGAGCMQFDYDNSGQTKNAYNEKNTAEYSELTRTLGQDWSVFGLQTLSLAFMGQSENSGSFYMKINDSKFVYERDNGNISQSVWRIWNIDLTSLGDSLEDVETLTLGIEGEDAEGQLLIDDIELYSQAGIVLNPTDPGSTGLLAQYSFEGNAKDTSGNAVNGSVTNGQFVSPGASDTGSAIEFEGDGYVDLGNPSAFDFATGDWSISAWFQTGVPTQDERGVIFGNGSDSEGGKRIMLIQNETGDGVFDVVCDDNVTKQIASSTTLTNDGEWHIVVAQRVGTEIRLYIDGILEGTVTVDATYDLSGTSEFNAYIGTITDYSTQEPFKMLDGQVDEVLIYNRALTEEEILWLAGQTYPLDKAF